MEEVNNPDNLSSFLEEFHERIVQGTFSDEEKTEIAEAVHAMVREITKVLYIFDPMFEVQEIHRVGSSYEGTKLGSPDEFDYGVEMQYFKSDTVEVRNDCGNLGVVHVILKDPSSTNVNDKVIVVEGNETFLSPVGFREFFSGCVPLLAKYLVSENTVIEKPTGSLCIFPDVKEHLDMLTSGPNIEIAMCWTSKKDGSTLGISVDITPCIKIHLTIPESCQVNTDILTESERQHILLVPTINRECKKGHMLDVDKKLCWRLSFSNVETKFVKSMNLVHKKCMRILKYIKSKQGNQLERLGLGHLTDKGLNGTLVLTIHGLGEMNFLTTYMIKMAVLQHALQCKKNEINLGSCLIEILQYIRSCMEIQNLPNIFLSKKNLWAQHSTAGNGPYVIKPHLINILQFLIQIQNIEGYDFESLYSEFIKLKNTLTESDGV